jgi:hypothetical protein
MSDPNYIPTTPPPGYADPSLIPGLHYGDAILISQWASYTAATGETPAPPPSGPPLVEVTGINPGSGPDYTAVTVSGTGLTGATNVNIDSDCTGLTVVNDSTLTAATDPTGKKGLYPVLVTVDGTVFTGPDFQRT